MTKRQNKVMTSAIAGAVLLAISHLSYAEVDKEEKDAKVTEVAEAVKAEMDKAEKDKEEDKLTLTETLADKTSFVGFVDIYRDKEDGSGLIILEENDLNKPVLYIASTVEGVVAAGAFRGQYRQARLIEFRRFFNRIDVVAKSNSYYFDPQNAISRAASANTSESVLVSMEISKEEDGKIAISLQDLVKNESLHRIAPMPPSDPKQAEEVFNLGTLSADKSRVSKINNFPDNTHIVVDYVFENGTPKIWGGAEIADQRYTTLSVQHAFVKVPENDFMPRRDDPRIGFFTQQIDDLTSYETVNYRDVINRWNLVKLNPEAALSDPVKPIVWWIENTTPIEWRETIKKATLAWNTSFEKAGFSNAIEVKIQPDDATWNADDIRYNVLRWTSSPTPPFGGYGPSVAHPITGEIIAADVMLEYSFLQGRWMAKKMLTDGASSLTSSLPAASYTTNSMSYCSLGHELTMGKQFAEYAGMANGLKNIEKDRLLRQSMHYLILHEVGHTLGLNHNMMATQLHGAKEAHNIDVTQGILAGSVMDYPAVNYAPVGMEQGDFYSDKPGPYDDWVIEYGYSASLSDPEAEKARLAKILNRSTEPQLAFGNDADDMRAPGRHVDPRINIYDMSNDAVQYAEDRFELIKSSASKLKDKLLVDGQSHNDLVVGVNILFREFGSQASVISRYVGGVYLNRAMVGQAGYTQPLTPVPVDYQKKAMNALNSYFFAPDAISHLEPLYAYLQRQRRSFSGWDRDESPRIHSMLLSAQKSVLDHLLHTNVMMRITDTALFGNKYTLDKMMEDLTDGMFSADIKGNVNTYRQQLQVEYVERLVSLSGLETASKHDTISQATATSELRRIAKMLNNNRGDNASKIHKRYLEDRIARAFYKN